MISCLVMTHPAVPYYPETLGWPLMYVADAQSMSIRTTGTNPIIPVDRHTYGFTEVPSDAQRIW